MRRFRLTVEYDGTDYAGFQWQPSPLRTVQAELETAIAKVSGVTMRVHGAGRTDTGVHALGQVVHFDTDWAIPVERIAFAINGELPRDIVVRNAKIVDTSFHARFSATSRTYRYTLWKGEQRSAIFDRFAWHIRLPLDTPAMRRAAAELTGTHDYATFGLPDEPGKSTLRHMDGWEFDERDRFLHLTVRGNAFLRSQVRAFIGTLVSVGLGKLNIADVVRIRDSRDRVFCPTIAPARGLTLLRVRYDGTRWTHFGEGDTEPDGGIDKKDKTDE